MDTELFTRINNDRVRRWHPGFPNDGWMGSDWSNAMVGEAGEAANVVKKLRREETGIQQTERMQSANDEAHHEMLLDKLADEIGDVYAYLDLLAQYYGINIGEAIIRKFNRISEREGFPDRMPT